MGRKGDGWHCECHDGFEGGACEHELESHCGDDIDNDGGMSSLYQLYTTYSNPNLRLDWMGTVLVNIYVYTWWYSVVVVQVQNDACMCAQKYYYQVSVND